MKKATLVLVVIAAFLSACANSSGPRKIALVPQSALGRGIYLLGGLDAGEGLIWSPDGRTLAGHITEMPMPDCFWCPEPYSEIFVIETAMWTWRSVLRSGPMVDSLSWFPDNQHLAYGADAMGADDPNPVRSIQIDGEHDGPLSDYDTIPIWSHDGTKVALRETVGAAGDRYPRLDVLDLRNGQRRTVFIGDVGVYIISGPSWSPDNTKLAFAYGRYGSQESPQPTIYEADIETGKATRLLADDQEYWSAEFAPSGNLIALIRRRSDITAVAAVLRDLASSCEVVLPLEDVWRAAWSPDGHKIVISGARKAYLVDLDEFLGTKFATTGSICP